MGPHTSECMSCPMSVARLRPDGKGNRVIFPFIQSAQSGGGVSPRVVRLRPSAAFSRNIFQIVVLLMWPRRSCHSLISASLLPAVEKEKLSISICDVSNISIIYDIYDVYNISISSLGLTDQIVYKAKIPKSVSN